MYYDDAVWFTENHFTRIHARWVSGEEWETVTVDEGNPRVDEEETTKPWVGHPGSVFDDNDATKIRFFNFLVGTPTSDPLVWIPPDPPPFQTFRAIPVSRSALHLLFVRVKAAVPTGYSGHFRVEYTRADGAVITALSNTRYYDGYVRVAADVLEVRLVGEGDWIWEKNQSEIWLDYYIFRPYFVAPSRVYGVAPGGRVVNFCIPRTYDDRDTSLLSVQTSVELQDLMTVPPGHPFQSAFHVFTSLGWRSLVVYE